MKGELDKEIRRSLLMVSVLAIMTPFMEYFINLRYGDTFVDIHISSIFVAAFGLIGILLLLETKNTPQRKSQDYLENETTM